MKKFTAYILTLVFGLGFGTAYALDSNGVTDFSGKAYDRQEIEIAHAMNAVQGESAGGMRVESTVLGNGVTDFSGRAYDRQEIELPHAMNAIQGESAGGLRAEAKTLGNGVTDFTGKVNDRGDISW